MKVKLEDIFEIITLRNDMNLFSIIINKTDAAVSDGHISKHTSVSSKRKIVTDKTMIVVKNAKYVILYNNISRKMSLIISKDDLNNTDVISNVMFESDTIRRKWQFRDTREEKRKVINDMEKLEFLYKAFDYVTIIPEILPEHSDDPEDNYQKIATMDYIIKVKNVVEDGDTILYITEKAIGNDDILEEIINLFNEIIKNKLIKKIDNPPKENVIYIWSKLVEKSNTLVITDEDSIRSIISALMDSKELKLIGDINTPKILIIERTKENKRFISLYVSKSSRENYNALKEAYDYIIEGDKKIDQSTKVF